MVETLPHFSAPPKTKGYHRPVPAALARAAKLIFGLYVMFIAYESLIPSGAVQSVPHLDKVVHAGAYFVFALLLAVAMPRLSLKTVFACAFIFGTVMEIGQAIAGTGRTASLGDLTANGFGALLAVCMCVLMVKFFRKTP